jgi:photosystem II stability/assembly factor-like uncharacterized protein
MRQADVVQAAGGHDDPVFYVGDPGVTKGLWKWKRGETSWKRIVPDRRGRASEARIFFADPYDSDVVYLLDKDSIERSDDGGQSWRRDDDLDRAVTDRGQYSHDFKFLPVWVGLVSVLSDMVFDRDERGTRFAVGLAGAFFTVDGRHWQRLMSSQALPGYPVSAYFDRVSDPSRRALYVAMNGRGIVKVSPVPAP